ncbi:hypothetical protein ACPA9J_27040 [Pseudomonas aeruginosa]
MLAYQRRARAARHLSHPCQPGGRLPNVAQRTADAARRSIALAGADAGVEGVASLSGQSADGQVHMVAMAAGGSTAPAAEP